MHEIDHSVANGSADTLSTGAVHLLSNVDTNFSQWFGALRGIRSGGVDVVVGIIIVAAGQWINNGGPWTNRWTE